MCGATAEAALARVEANASWIEVIPCALAFSRATAPLTLHDSTGALARTGASQRCSRTLGQRRRDRRGLVRRLPRRLAQTVWRSTTELGGPRFNFRSRPRRNRFSSFLTLERGDFSRSSLDTRRGNAVEIASICLETERPRYFDSEISARVRRLIRRMSRRLARRLAAGHVRRLRSLVGIKPSV